MLNDISLERCARGMALLDAGYATDGKVLLTEVMAKLHAKMDGQDVSDADQIAAAEALGKLLVDPNFPNEWFQGEDA